MDLKGGTAKYSHSSSLFSLATLRSRERALRALPAPSLFVLNVRRCDRRAHRTAFAHGIDRVCSGAFELAAACGPISPCCRMHACSLQASLLLSCSQDDGDAHQLCSGEDECPQPRRHVGGVFPGRDQDCVRIIRPHDQSLGFWCAASSKSPLLAKTDACWLVRQARWSC